MSESISVKQMLEAGAHFGHLTGHWHPRMKSYIFTQRNGIHILDLEKTASMLEKACEYVKDLVSKGGSILFVGTKKQAQEVIEEEAKRCGMFYVNQRWLGGMLTNFATIRKSIKRLNSIIKMETDGTFEALQKKERLVLTREKEKLEKVLGGIATMNKLPGAIYLIDVKKEHIAVDEARKLGIQIYAIVDTNCDPELIDYPIPANDDAVKSIELITRVVADAIIDAKQTQNMKKMARDEEVPSGDRKDVVKETAGIKPEPSAEAGMEAAS